MDHVDPFAGSYVIEEMTSKIYEASMELINKIESEGGALVIVRRDSKEIHESAWKHLNSIESGSLSVVGVVKIS